MISISTFLGVSFYGPGLVALVSLLTSIPRMHRVVLASRLSIGGQRIRHPWRTIAAVLTLWLALSVGAVLAAQFIGFANLMAAAHSRGPIPEATWTEPLIYLCISLALMALIGEFLFRFVRQRYRRLNQQLGIVPVLAAG